MSIQRPDVESYKPQIAAGVALETPRFNRVVVGATLHLAEIINTFKPLKITGEIPESGPFMVAFNHSHSLDGPLALIAVAWAAKRSSHIVARDSLLDRRIKEEPEVLERTGKKNDWLNVDIKRTDIIGRVLAKLSVAKSDLLSWFILQGDPLGIHRGSKKDFNDAQVKAIMQAQIEGRGVLIAMEETRSKALLEKPMDGPAVINRILWVEGGLNIPIIPTRIRVPLKLTDPRTWFKPFEVSFGEAISWKTYREQVKIADSNNIPKAHGLTLAIVDRIKSL